MLDERTTFVKALKWKEENRKNLDLFPYCLPVMQQLETLTFHPNVTFIVGENGMGKSTLIETIATLYGFNPEGGTLNFNFSSYDSHVDMHDDFRLVKSAYRPKEHFFLRAESFYNVATEIERLDEEGMGQRIIDSFGGKSLHEQSHGEAFFSLFNEKLGGNGLYIFDEPEAALSPLRQMSLMTRMNELVKQHSQFIIATHSPILMAYPHATIYEVSENGMKKTPYVETGHFQLLKQFYADPNRFVHHLLVD